MSAKPSSELLDTVLRDLTPDQRARVLELVVRLDLDQDDPLWLVAIAIGQLQVLVEDAPNDWQGLFSAFQGDLNIWTQTHLQTLEMLANRADKTADLAEYTQQLGATLQTLIAACNGLIQRLQVLESSSLDSATQLLNSTSKLENGVEALTATNKRQLRQILDALERVLPASHQGGNRRASSLATIGGGDPAARLSVVFSALSLLGVIWLISQQ